MYIPKHFEVADLDEISRFVSDIQSADLVTVDPAGFPISTLMPCIWDRNAQSKSDYGTLVMHMARGNQQWKSLQIGTPGLAIVHGPQAYISPTNYENKTTDHKVVPTWNYQSVHLSGSVEIVEDAENLRRIVTGLTNFHESTRQDPWSVEDADPKYLEAQLHGIVGVILHIDKVEGKFKLSQNRSKNDQEMIIADLESAAESGDHEIAEAMKESL